MKFEEATVGEKVYTDKQKKQVLRLKIMKILQFILYRFHFHFQRKNFLSYYSRSIIFSYQQSMMMHEEADLKKWVPNVNVFIKDASIQQHMKMKESKVYFSQVQAHQE